MVGLLASSAEAAVIIYGATQVSGNTWRYDYVVQNDGSITSELRLFDILFDSESYVEDSLALLEHPAGWDPVILASGVSVPAAYDVLATGAGLGVGQSIDGFAVSFTWLGEGAPPPQSFEVYDPTNFALLGTGTTTALPAPGALVSMLAGVLIAATRARRRRHT